MSTSNPEEEAPLLEQLQKTIDSGKLHLSKDQVGRGPAGWIPNRFRALLRKIYGKESSLLCDFRSKLDSPPPDNAREFLEGHLANAERLIELLKKVPEQASRPQGERIFIGHGRSLVWLQLKDFLFDRLNLKCDEFNRESVAGIATSERLKLMLDQAAFAFLVMTGEDKHADSSVHARENVIHEIGLFQGRLGMHKAIVLIEDGCAEFSNISGLTYLPFPKGHIGATFEDIRRVLERENTI